MIERTDLSTNGRFEKKPRGILCIFYFGGKLTLFNHVGFIFNLKKLQTPELHTHMHTQTNTQRANLPWSSHLGHWPGCCFSSKRWWVQDDLWGGYTPWQLAHLLLPRRHWVFDGSRLSGLGKRKAEAFNFMLILGPLGLLMIPHYLINHVVHGPCFYWLCIVARPNDSICS